MIDDGDHYLTFNPTVGTAASAVFYLKFLSICQKICT